MLSQINDPGSDDWWFMKCALEMGESFPRLHRIKRYRDGDALVPEEASGAMREAYKKWANQGRLTLTDLIVKAKTDRQKPVGFRTAAAGDDLGDDLAWATWKRSHMGVYGRDFFNDVGHYGAAYLAVTGSPKPGDGDDVDFALPLLIPSSGWSTYTVQNPATPWIADAAITIRFDPALGADVVTLFRPGYMRTAVKPTKATTIPNDGSVWNPGTDWTWIGAPIQFGYTDQVPVFKLEAPDGVGLYEKHLDTIDRINETIKQRQTIIAMQAFRQRAIKGDLPKQYPADHPNAGEDVDYDSIFKAGPAALWMIPDDAEIWESTPTDITPIVSANKEDIKYLAAVTTTPLYVLSPDAVSGSAEGAALVKEMNAFSVEDLNERADAVFAAALACAFLAMRDQARADEAQIETIWASIDRLSVVQRAQSAPAAKQGGMPQRMIDEQIFGFTPSQIRQAQQDRQNELFDTEAATPTSTAAPVSAVADPVLDPAAAVVA